MTIDVIKKIENEFPKAFTSCVEKDYGIFFFNEKNRNSYDSNHAVLFEDKISNLSCVLEEIKTFYLAKEIIPRIYQPFERGYFFRNKEIFESCSYEINVYGNNKVMLLSDKNEIQQSNNLIIKRIIEWDEDILNFIFKPAGEEYEISIAKKHIEDHSSYVFVGYYNGKPVIISYFKNYNNVCTRFNYILTAPEYRGRRFGNDLICYMVNFCRNKGINNCYQWPANSISEKICFNAGFRTIFEYESGEAVYRIKKDTRSSESL